jgi:arylsulfatase
MPLDRDISQREILPIPDRAYVGPVMYTADDPASEFPPIKPIRPPEGAPNVLIVLIDDVGFGASSPFGGPIDTPTAQKLAEGGLKFIRFHTTALCAPTRAALLTGRNPHSVGMGVITELATSAPGSTSMIPNSAASIAKILRYNGYSTAHFGKCHEVPVWETGPTGPFDRWPTYQGFEKFYGFVAGETNQYYPTLYDGTSHIELPEDENYHLTEDLADQAIKWIHTQKSLAPDKPFFMYFAPGATHAPHHVPADWIDKYEGQFEDGWDVLRGQTFARQKALGVIPPDAALTERHNEIPAWNEMDEDIKDVLRREMEIYASFLSHTDDQIGRLIETLTALELLENTIVVYILGDNGASAEGTFLGTFNEMINFNGIDIPDDKEKEFLKDNVDKFGSKEAYNHYAVGWAHAMCTPYQWTKQVASHFGGTRNGMIVHWPKGIQGAGELRNQFSYVTDVCPTILEAIGLPEPVSVDGVLQKPIEGTSFFYTFNDAIAPERHKTQYFEMFGNRGIYHEGWTAVTRHATPWILTGETLPEFDDDVWELYDTNIDWTQAHNLAGGSPDKLKDLQTLFLIEAARYNVFPLNDLKVGRGHPGPETGAVTSQTYIDGMFVPDPCVINTFNRSYTITAAITVPAAAANGVILARGNDFGGYGLYVKDGILIYVYNYLGIETTKVEASRALEPGDCEVRMEFRYTGGDTPGQGGTVELFRNDEQRGLGNIPATNPVLFNVDAFLMVGDKSGGPLCDDFEGDNRFTGKVHWAKIELPDLVVSPISLAQRMRALMAIQ